MAASPSDKSKHLSGVNQPGYRPQTELQQIVSTPSELSQRASQSTSLRTLRAAKTRALKTRVGYGQEEAEQMFPSNVFVRLRIATKKLKQLGFPTVKTRLEIAAEQRAQELLSTSSSVQGHCIQIARQRPGAWESYPHQQGWQDNGVRNEREIDFPTLRQDDLNGAQTLGVMGVPTNRNGDSLSRQLNKGVQASPNLAQSSHNPFILQPTDSSRLHQPFPSSLTTYLPSNSTSSARPDLSASLGSSQHTESFQLNRLPTQFTHPSPESKVLVRQGAEVPQPAAEPSTRRRSFLETVLNPVANAAQAISEDSTPTRFKSSLDLSVLSPSGAYSSKKPKTGTSNPTPIGFTKRQVVIPQAISSRTNSRNPENPGEPELSGDMAPVRDPNNVENALKETIQNLYEMQSQVQGFVPETQPLLIEKMTELTQSLARIQTLTSTTQSPNNPIHNNRIAPEVIDYVDDSRNPDIYNREFVELVQRGNAVINGKQKAFQDFSEIFAQALKDGMPHLSDEVDKVMENAKTNKKTNVPGTGESSANGAGNTIAKGDGRTGGDAATNGSRAI